MLVLFTNGTEQKPVGDRFADGLLGQNFERLCSGQRKSGFPGAKIDHIDDVA